MKKVFYLLGCITLLSACTQKEKTETSTTTAQEATVAEYALPLDTAIAYAKRYNYMANKVLKDPAPIRAYTIRAADLLEAMGLPLNYVDSAMYDHVRVYIGMDANNKFRLLLTPVENADIANGKAGDDVILKGPFSSGNATSGDPVMQGQYVMDFTGPCPNSCSTGPLNQ